MMNWRKLSLHHFTFGTTMKQTIDLYTTKDGSDLFSPFRTGYRGTRSLSDLLASQLSVNLVVIEIVELTH